MGTEVVTWWLVVQALGLVGLPLASFVFRALPDRGYAFGKSLGLLLTSYIAWVLAMSRLVPFGLPLLLVAMLLVGGGGLWLVCRQRPPDSLPCHRAVLAYLRRHWHSVLFYEAVFLAALLVEVWLRAHVPDPWGTERPMDYAFFNAIRRGGTFPPPDPWLAGYSINYYYFGYLMMAAVSLLSQLEASVSFNLSLALVYGLAALNVAGVVVNLIALAFATQCKADPASDSPPVLHLGGRYVAALLGVVLVLFAGNQAGALQIITGDHRVVALDGWQMMSALAQAQQGAEEIVLPYPVRTHDFGTFDKLKPVNDTDNFNWWWPSRALWDAQPPEGGGPGEPPAPADPSRPPIRIYNITEFPFFSFWLGDMHPHVMALPAGLLAMALALATLAHTRLPSFTAGWQGWLDLVLAAIILGSLYATNSWDLPTYTLLYVAVLFLLAYRHAPHPDAIPWFWWFKQVVLLAIAMWLVLLPFSLTFHSLVGSAEPLTSVPLLSKFTQIVAPYHAAHTGLHAFLVIFGLFVIPLLALAYLVGDHTPAAVSDTGRPPPPSPWMILPWLGPVLLIIGVLVGFPLLSMVGFGMFAFYRAMHHSHKPAVAFLLLVVALGCAICFGTDLMYIRDVFNTRMNTIFKFYYQVWLLWGTATAGAVWWLLAGRRVKPEQEQATRRMSFLPARLLVLAVFLLLLAGGLVYPAINLRDMSESTHELTLEGQTPREHTPAGVDSVRWLREHAEPGSVLLEAVAPGGGSYNTEGYGGVAAATGIPTVLGWFGHESQWRGGDEAARSELGPRQADVDTIYSTQDTEQARRLLAKYGVTYVYVGRLERQLYSPESLAKFERIGRAVFDADGVTIYRLGAGRGE